MSEFRRKLMMAYAANLGRGDITYPGLIAAWSAKGKTNDDEDRAILKDLTGNGHDITLNGFAFSEMSGYGGYNLNFKNYNKTNSIVNSIIESNRIILNPEDSDSYYVHLIYGTTEINSFTCSIKGIQEKGVLTYEYANSTENKRNTVLIDSDGIYTIPKSDKVTNTYQVGFRIKKKIINQIVIELLPEYPDALVFDGINDYGINENLSALTDFTFIYKAIPLNDTTSAKGIAFSKKDGNSLGEFIIGKKPMGQDFFGFYSFGQSNNVSNYVENITYATTNTFNGNIIEKGSNKGSNSITIGSLYKNMELANMVFYSAYLFDRSLDEQEIKEFIRKYIDPEYLLPSEIPTPDCYYDFSQGSNDDETRDTIKDLSGNGNDAKAYNIAWADMSGYGGFALLPRKSYVISKVDNSNNLIYKSPKPGTRVVLHISGIPDGAKVISRARVGVHFEASVDGTYIIEDTGDVATIAVTDFTGECNIEITEEPQYPGALVFDGIDDYITLEAFDSGFKTVFMVMSTLTPKNINKNEKYYHQKGGTNVWGWDERLAYQYDESITLINGIKNTTLTKKQLALKKHLAVNYKDIEVEQLIPKIGGDPSTYRFGNMALYKFLGFKEVLTEEQINAVIKKYNLLDGVDEIEVS